jgi:hypothetical protein
MNKPPANQTMEMDQPIILTARLFFTLLLLALAVFLWHESSPIPWANEKAAGAALSCGLFAGVFFVVALYLQFNTRRYLDFADRQVVTVKRFGYFETSKRIIPFANFSHVVVRHLCHSDSEGPDTYTGGVGLKPVDGGPVFWVKSFPTTEDEVPQAAYVFARELQELTGQPGVLAEKETTNTEVKRQARRSHRLL